MGCSCWVDSLEEGCCWASCWAGCMRADCSWLHYFERVVGCWMGRMEGCRRTPWGSTGWADCCMKAGCWGDCWVACWVGCWADYRMADCWVACWAGCWVEGCSEAVCCRSAGVGCWVEGCLEAACCTTAGVGCWAEGCWVEDCSEAVCCRTAGVDCWAEGCWVADCLEEPCTCSQPTSSIGVLQTAISPSSLAAMLALQATRKALGWWSHSCEHQRSTQKKQSTPADTLNAVNNDIHGNRRPENLAMGGYAVQELQCSPPVAGLCRRWVVWGRIGGRGVSPSAPAAAAALRGWIAAAAALRSCATPASCAAPAAAEAYTGPDRRWSVIPDVKAAVRPSAMAQGVTDCLSPSMFLAMTRACSLWQPMQCAVRGSGKASGQARHGDSLDQGEIYRTASARASERAFGGLHHCMHLWWLRQAAAGPQSISGTEPCSPCELLPEGAIPLLLGRCAAKTALIW